MANLRFIGQNTAAYGPQHLATVDTDVLLVSTVTPAGGGVPLIVEPSAAFTLTGFKVRDNSQDILILNSVAAAGTGTNTAFQISDKTGISLMSLRDDGQLTLRGAAVVGSGGSTVAGTLTITGAFTTNSTLSAANPWVDGTLISSATSLSLAPSNTTAIGSGTSVDLVIASGITPDAEGVAANIGSLMLHDGGTAWVKTGAGSTAWTQLASAGGASLQTAYLAGASITTTALGPVTIDSSGVGGASLTLTGGAGASALNVNGAAGTSMVSATGSGFSTSLDVATSLANGGSYTVIPTTAAAAGTGLVVEAGAAGSGTGGVLQLVAGAGAGAGSTGGLLQLAAGLGTATGGALSISSGGGAAAGAVDIQVGGGTAAAISIGTSNPATIAIGSASNASTVYHAEVTGSAGNASVALNTGATSASTAVGSYAIGVNTVAFDSLLSINGAKPHEDLQSTLDALDDAVGVLNTANTVHTLQLAYDGAGAGAGKAISAANGAVSINSVAGNTTALLLTSSAANSALDAKVGSLPVLSLSGTATEYTLTPAAATAVGAGVSLAAGAAGATGAGGALALSAGLSNASTGGSINVVAGDSIVSTGGFSIFSGGSGVVGGVASLVGGTGTTGNGGGLNVLSGSSTGGGNGGPINIDVGTGTIAGAMSIGGSSPVSIFLGTEPSASTSITIGATTNAGALVNHRKVTSSAGDTVVALNASSSAGGNTSVGSYSIGVDSGDLTNIGLISNPNLQTTLTAIDTTIGTLSTAADASITTLVVQTLAVINPGDVVAMTATGAISADSGTPTSVLGMSVSSAAVTGNGTLTVDVMLSGKVTTLTTAIAGTAPAPADPVYLIAGGALSIDAPVASGDLLIRMGYIGDTTSEVVLRMSDGVVI